MTLTRFRVRRWYNDRHLGRQAVQRVLPHDSQSPRNSCRHPMGIYWSCSALCWWHSGELRRSSLGFEAVHRADVYWSVSVVLLKLPLTLGHYVDLGAGLSRSSRTPTVSYYLAACSLDLVLDAFTSRPIFTLRSVLLANSVAVSLAQSPSSGTNWVH